jgi:hypothetical protein
MRGPRVRAGLQAMVDVERDRVAAALAQRPGARVQQRHRVPAAGERERDRSVRGEGRREPGRDGTLDRVSPG